MRPKIINIMLCPPAYGLFWNDPFPEVSWNTSDGKRVGIWGKDWPALLGKEVLKLTNEFLYEVWQPDLRADKAYAHTFESGLVYRLFPAVNRKNMFGFKSVNRIHSGMLIRELTEHIKKENIILHLNGDPIVYNNFFALSSSIPILTSYHGVIQLPSTRLFSCTKNFPSKLNHIKDHYILKKIANKIDYITYQNDTNISSLKKIYSGRSIKVTMGCDFSFWRSEDSNASRRKLGLPQKRKIFLSASLLTSLKQIDSLISVFNQLERQYDFLLIIAGHGIKEYEEYLKNFSLELSRKDRIKFVGFLSGEKFRTYYNACDFFISTSKQEGGPVSVMKAFACEVPVISTKTGHTAEVMAQHDCGCLLEVYNYEMWKETIEEILKGKRVVKPIDREIARKHYDWQNIAQKFLDIYRFMAKEYYS